MWFSINERCAHIFVRCSPSPWILIYFTLSVVLLLLLLALWWGIIVLGEVFRHRSQSPVPVRNRILHFFWEFSISTDERIGQYEHVCVNIAKNTVYLSTIVQLHIGAFRCVDVSFLYQIYSSLAPPCGGFRKCKRLLRFVVSIWLETRIPPKVTRPPGFHNPSLKT